MFNNKFNKNFSKESSKYKPFPTNNGNYNNFQSQVTQKRDNFIVMNKNNSDNRTCLPHNQKNMIQNSINPVIL